MSNIDLVRKAANDRRIAANSGKPKKDEQTKPDTSTNEEEGKTPATEDKKSGKNKK